MKKHSVLYVCLIIVILILAGCAGTPASKPEAAASDSSETVASVEFTLEELKVYNGKEGQLAYVAVDGIVYDVTDIPEWQEGIHQGKFEAGNDLSEEIKQSPHGKSFLKKAKEIGILK